MQRLMLPASSPTSLLGPERLPRTVRVPATTSPRDPVSPSVDPKLSKLSSLADESNPEAVSIAPALSRDGQVMGQKVNSIRRANRITKLEGDIFQRKTGFEPATLTLAKKKVFEFVHGIQASPLSCSPGHRQSIRFA